MTQTIDACLPASGAPFAAGGDRPFLLHAGGCWSVLEGRLDLFATRVQDGRAVGARTHLFRVEAGEAVWGVAPHPATGLGVLAVGGTATVLAESDPAALRALGEFGGERAAVAEALDRWVEHLSRAVAEPLPSKRVHTAAPGTEAMVEEGGCVAPEDAVVWLQPSRGTLRLMGRPAGHAATGGWVPLGGRGWVDAPSAAVIRVHGTEEMLEAGRVWDALDEAHARVLSLVAERLAAQDEDDRDRLRARARTTGRTLHAALGRLATTLDVAPARGGMRMREAGDADEDTLVAAARLVLEHGGVDVPERVSADLAGSRDPMGALARAFRVRARRVALTEGWWRGESGALLGRLAEGERAVALLPGRSGYDMLDPATRVRQPVTAEAAQTLTPFAYSFYRPFAPGPLGVMQVVRFGLFGCGRDLAILLGVAVVMALLGLVTPLAVGTLFNHIIPGAERGQLAQLTVVLLVCAFATAAFQAVRAVAMLRMESRASAAIQSAVWDRLLSLPLPFFRDYSAGDLAVRAMGVEEIRRILSGAVVGALLSGAFSISNFALLFRVDAGLAVRAVLLIVAALAISLAVSLLQLKHQREILRLRARTSGVVLQLLTGVGKLKMSGAEVQAFGLWSRLFSEQRERQYRSRVAANWLTVFNAAYPVVCAMVLFSAVAARAAEKGMNTGDFLAFTAAFSVCLSAALSVSAAAVSALGAVPLYEQVKPILHAEPEAHAGKGDPGELMGAVELQHVTFRYQADGPLVLRDVSVRIRPGEFVAFVGPSGSGKSTVFRMLLGFESPESGSVSYDQQDLAGLDIEAVRRQIGVVMQSGKLMAGDIFTNIVGSSPATLEDAWEAARMAGLDEDLKQMPMGMHTVVSEGGGTLSGGQRQRLMIARAVVHRPRILLFDEATSALDNRTQAIVSQSLDRLKATRVVVAHRLSTVMNADRIYVVQAGVVVESGTPAELLARDGVFAELARRQTA